MVCSEMSFGDVIRKSKFISYKSGLKVQMPSVNKIYIVAALLHTAYVCLYGATVSEYFNCKPPKLYD